jgi:hypothetical protein
MAKDARDDQDSGRFTLWMTRLQEVAKLQKDWHARWAQEQCLYALGRLDYAAVRSHLASWPTDTLSAFWGTKKAAILAEIGRVPAATATAEAALSAIRGRQQTVPGDIGLLSQEGWTMLLLRQLTLDPRFREPRDNPAEDRRDHLGAYRCNPWPDIQIRAGDVMRRRDPKRRRTTRRQFDPGRWTTYILFSRDEWDSVHAAFVFLRMLEYGGLPIRCGQTLIFPEPVTAAVDAIWSAAAAPLLALSTLLRVGTSQDIERTFDRSAIARLSDDQITFLLELTTTAIRQAIQRMHAGEEGSPLQNSSLITVSTEMLSRLAVCLSDDRLEELLQLAITLYRDPLLRGIRFQRSLSNLFRRIISALPQDRIGMKAHDLAELPIPGVGGFEVQDPEGWTEPFAGWPWHKIPVGGERQTWARTIDWLTSVAATAAAGPRGHALIRLHRLYRLDILTGPQIQGFGEALWARLEDGLPSETLFRPSAFVVLPHPENQRPLAALHAYLLQRDFRRLVGTSPGVFSFHASEDMYLHTLVDVTRTQWRGDEPHHYIDWSRAEALTILEKWKGWWAAHKPALAGRDISDVPATVRKEVQQMLEVLSQVVFPRIGDATPAEKSQALALLRDVDAAGASSTPAIPSAIYVGMEPLAAARRLRTELLNSSTPTVVDAIRGIQYWVYNLSTGGLPPPHVALIDDLVRLVALRRSPALVSALTVLSDVVKRVPYLLTDDHWQIISTALNFLERETSLQASDIETSTDELRRSN